jgi:hypothetical protein
MVETLALLHRSDHGTKSTDFIAYSLYVTIIYTCPDTMKSLLRGSQ